MNIKSSTFVAVVGLLALCGTLLQAQNTRDPFWPADYHGNNPVPVATPTPTPLPRGLTWEEKLAIAREEARKLQENIDAKGTITMRGRVHIFINDKFYTKGDSVIVERDGRKYRLVITELTEDNIQLEPFRIQERSAN